MKVSASDLHILVQTALESAKIADGGRVFTFTADGRKDAATRVLSELSGRDVEVDNADQP